jgi:branched-chain amino acid transport system substrate-binding protein
LSKAAVDRGVTQAVVVVTVREDGMPVPGAAVEFSRSISGRSAQYAWSGTTDEVGRARVALGENATGYYQARAWQDGNLLGRWSSIPINGGYEVLLDLAVGGKARVTGSSLLSSAPEEIAVGVVVSLTGPNALYGLSVRNGFELALEEVNGSGLIAQKIRFIVEDYRGTAAGAVETFGKLIHQDRVPVILGPGISTAAVEAFPIAQENQVVAFSSISSAAGLSAIGDFIFRASLTVDRMVPVGVATTREKLGYQRVAVLYDRIDLYSQSGYEALTEAFADNGVEVVATETFETGDTDFSAQLTRIQALDPDAVFVSALSLERTLILQGRDLGVPFIFLGMTIDEVQAAGASAEGAITFTGWTHTATTPGNPVFVQKYGETYGENPNPWAAQSYAAVHVLAEALAKGKSTDAHAIRAAMADIRDFDTVLGSFSFDADGDAIYDPLILVARDGRLEVFE